MISKDKKRITISLPKDQVETIDKLMIKTQLTRSQLIAVILAILASWDMGKTIGNSIGNALDKALNTGRKTPPEA